MTCLEAQSKIIAYIDYNLEKEQKTEFLKHIQCCKDCKEELNIYYTLIEGMRHLDDSAPLSKDFTEELDYRIEHELKQNRKKKDLVRSAVLLAIAGIFTCMIFAYVYFLDMLHNDEQAKLKEAQGKYYYSETFHDVLFEPEKQQYILNVEIEEEKEMTFYEKVRQYNMYND